MIDELSLSLLHARQNLIVSATQTPDGWVGQVLSGSEVMATTDVAFPTEEDALEHAKTILAQARNYSASQDAEAIRDLPASVKHFVQGDHIKFKVNGQVVSGLICGRTDSTWIVALDHRIVSYPYSHVVVSPHNIV